MKNVIALAAFISTAVFAQAYDPAMNPPDGAVGKPVELTKRTTGKVIAIGEALYDSVPVERICINNDGREVSTVINTGSIVGAVGGAIVGNQFGQGDGKTAATIVGAVGGAYAGNKVYQNSQQPRNPNDNCRVRFEQKLRGYPVTIQYFNLQIPGFSAYRLPRIGEDFEIIIKSFYFPGNASSEIR